jgi:hypothetical protein
VNGAGSMLLWGSSSMQLGAASVSGSQRSTRRYPLPSSSPSSGTKAPSFVLRSMAARIDTRARVSPVFSTAKSPGPRFHTTKLRPEGVCTVALAEGASVEGAPELVGVAAANGFDGSGFGGREQPVGSSARAKAVR